MKVLAVDVWGQYAHYKKIYATTSAVSYLLPPKTTLYGWLAAILGLPKESYLEHFQEGDCQIALQLRPHPQRKTVSLEMTRVPFNLRPDLKGSVSNRKPTLMEFVRYPSYRLYVAHQDEELFNNLKAHLQAHTAVYTPTLGLANLFSNFAFVGSFESQNRQTPEVPQLIHSVIPKASFIAFDTEALKAGIEAGYAATHEIVEQSMYALEMDTDRYVTRRDDILLERTGKTIPAFVKAYHTGNGVNLMFF
ncbi:MAG: type I-B CRISPR-associated protein Cas5b [Bernardetiaceae bacterium]